MNPNNTEQGRLAALRRLQNQYDRDAEEKAKKQKVIDERKRKERLAQLEEMTKQMAMSGDGHRLGTVDEQGRRGELGIQNPRPVVGDDNPMARPTHSQAAGQVLGGSRPGSGSGRLGAINRLQREYNKDAKSKEEQVKAVSD
ncbi:uncharacterized protein LOC110850577 isoform X2 [Folsomia candida]|uniref:uncharacterized protein LOC110850577 isoform X2 n=1 Tax=Folsomia candida TaxID=158441 RepID=UPI000B8F806A|nr:uncharacterized protein LOC110850577 isoform X2 [Folsomia candida]